MGKLIIIEGSDLTGKTTIAKELGIKTKIPVVRPWMDLPNAKASALSIARTLHPLIKVLKPNIIYDRFFFSEYAYGFVLGRDYQYIHSLIEEWKDIENLFLIHLTASDESIRQRFQKRGDWYITINEVLEVKAKYIELIDDFPISIPILTIDTTNCSPSKCVSQIIKWLRLED